MQTFSSFDFKNLFVLDMANNHQGILGHGKRIITEHCAIAKKNKVRAGIKFQFRDLPDFVHIDEQKNQTNKHVPRFLSTIMSWDNYAELVQEVKANDCYSICTPFDEPSVDKIIELGFDIIKIASCSAKDWPLLEKVASANLPLIISTGGLSLHEVDNLVSFFTHKGCEFALMHCVSIYPTPNDACNLGSISNFCKRYPGITIGWSTHENPDEITQVGLAYALGGRMFERHIGIETDEIKLNLYSSKPKQTDSWMNAYNKAIEIIGSDSRNNLLDEEINALDDLKRGVFLKKDKKAGQKISKEDFYYAFPCLKNQLDAGTFSPEGVLLNDILVNQPLMITDYEIKKSSNLNKEIILKHAIHDVKALLNYSGVSLNHEFHTEYSHHYGIERFREVGAVLITVVNREYAKKIIVQLPMQRHPLHMHKLKEETFLVLSGDLIIELDGVEHILGPGEQVTVMPGVWHQFTTNKGAVFEEISTTAHRNDSTYRDSKINNLEHSERKTVVDHWGRFQINKSLS